MTDALAVLDKIRAEIEKVSTIDDARDIRDRAEAIRAYAKKAKKGLAVQNRAAVIKIRAERKAGQLISAMGKHPGELRRGNIVLPRDEQRLSDIGVTKMQSSRWQAIARIPEKLFESAVSKWDLRREELEEEISECTTNFFLKLAAQCQEKDRINGFRKKGAETCTIDDLKRLVTDGKRYGTIYVDPPWQYSNQATRAATDTHYETVTVDWLKDEREFPLGQLAAPDCHLHLWTTVAFLPECFSLMRAWGFEYKSSMVWVKPDIGLGNYWRLAHEYLLLGVKGNCPFLDKSRRSWKQVESGEHSKKPDAFRWEIEAVSPNPKIELFARDVTDGWTCWGNEIRRNLFTASIK